ncbi:MAG: hypothetical protein ACI9O4_000070 [Chitinophagales bacterium]|jgi:hypothetical protein
MKGHLLNHPLLTQGKEKRVKKVFIDPEQDIPAGAIHAIAKQQIELC